MTDVHPSAAALEAYVLQGDCDRDAIEAHAAACSTCIASLAALTHAMTPASPDDENSLREMMSGAQPRGALVVPLRRYLGAAIAAAAAAAAVFLAWPRPPVERPEDILAGALAGARPLAARAALDVPWSRYQPSRGGRDQVAALDRALGDLLRLKERDPSATARALALVYVSRGDPGDRQLAAEELARASDGPERRNDEAMILLAAGDGERALAKLDEALGSAPNLLPALFNRALALEALQRDTASVAAWERYLTAAGDGDRGWSEEGRQRLADLRRRIAAGRR